MRVRSWKRWLVAAVVAGLFVPWAAQPVRAGEKWKRLSMQLDRILQLVLGRKKSMHAFYSDHYGYYPNTWRKWPAQWESWRKRFSAAQGAPIELPTPAAENGVESHEKTAEAARSASESQAPRTITPPAPEAPQDRPSEQPKEQN